MKITNQSRNKTRYDYNLTIMKSPKPATDNKFKWTLCIVTNWTPFWKCRPIEIVRCLESIQDIIIYLHMKFRWNKQCWICAVLWWPFWKWWPIEIFQCQESIRTSLSIHISNFDDIGQCWIFTADFLCRVLADRHLENLEDA